MAPRAGLGHYGRNICFSLRNLPFGFLTQLIRAAFPPTWSAESLLLVLQGGNSANKKAHAYAQALCLLAPRAGLEPAT
jgi:hypothetical protein